MSAFAKLYDPVMFPLEKFWIKKIRRNLLKNVSGKVFELGAGTGANFLFYPANVYVRAVEPNAEMRAKAEKEAQAAKATIELVAGRGEGLACPDDAYDYALATLVLCSVQDPKKVIQELYRILKPGGKLILFEHVRVDNPFWSKVQDDLTPGWARVCDNCHLNRDTVKLVEEVFAKVELKYHFHKIFVEITGVKK